MHIAGIYVRREKTHCTGSSRRMKLFEGWWERVPFLARIVFFVVSIVGMILGGSASGYWQ